jgi:hypothetical protein
MTKMGVLGYEPAATLDTLERSVAWYREHRGDPVSNELR